MRKLRVHVNESIHSSNFCRGERPFARGQVLVDKNWTPVQPILPTMHAVETRNFASLQ